MGLGTFGGHGGDAHGWEAKLEAVSIRPNCSIFPRKTDQPLFRFPSSSVTVAPSFWGHCKAPEATCLVSHPERFPVLDFPAPPSHIPPSQPLSLCHSPPAFAHLHAHASWHWHRLGTLFLLQIEKGPQQLMSTPAKVCIRFPEGAELTSSRTGALQVLYLSLPAPRLGCDGSGSFGGFGKFWPFCSSCFALL